MVNGNSVLPSDTGHAAPSLVRFVRYKQPSGLGDGEYNMINFRKFGRPLAYRCLC